MKPRYRPGKPATAGRRARDEGKALHLSQIRHLAQKPEKPKLGPKEGKGGKRADWDLNYESRRKYDAKKMMLSEYEAFSHEGVRRLPKRSIPNG